MDVVEKKFTCYQSVIKIRYIFHKLAYSESHWWKHFCHYYSREIHSISKMYKQIQDAECALM